MKYLKQIGIILIIATIAEVIKFIIPLPIPAGIYGMVILFTMLGTGVLKQQQISDTSDYLISIMGVMFVPAGVGIINNIDSMLTMFPAIVISITITTILVMLVSGKVTQFFAKKEGK